MLSDFAAAKFQFERTKNKGRHVCLPLFFLRETALMYERSVAVRFFEQGLFHLVDEIRSLYFPFQNVRSYLIGSGQLNLQESFEVRDDACE